MTTTIMAQKFMSVKLCKSEIGKIKWLRDNNIENTYKVIPHLKQTIDNQVKNKICRLCLNSGKRRIFGAGDFNFVEIIKKLLNIEVKKNDGKPQHICKACETTLKSAEKLKQTAEVTEWRLQKELEIMTSPLLENDTKESTPHGGYFVEQDTKLKREWSCGKCRRTFNSQEAFTEHEKLRRCHCPNESYVCETCGVKLKSMTRLKRHRMIHTGELQFPCSHCPYRGRTKYALQVHERAHTGVRPLACSDCSATFLNSSNLASHKKKHLPPSYHCIECAKSFKFKEAVQNHLATKHSTAKPHICNSCGKTFPTRKMMCRHERTVHNRPKMRSGILPTYLRQQGDSNIRY